MTGFKWSTRLGAIAAVCSLAACEGSIELPVGVDTERANVTTPTSELAPSSGEPVATGVEPAREAKNSTCDPATIADTGAIRRLTEAQYLNTLQELTRRLGVATERLASPFPSRTAATFSTDYLSNTVSAATARALGERSQTISTSLTGDLETLLGCQPSGAANDPCVQTFIDRFAALAFRRPTDRTTTQPLRTLYDELVAELGARESLQAVIEASIESPLFLYLDAGAPSSGAARRAFDAYALANRLSYFLWDDMPDEALFQAAAQGALDREDTLRREVERMVEDRRAIAVARRFHREWLHLADPSAMEANRHPDATWTPELAASVVEESGRFIDSVVWETTGNYEDLMLSRRAHLDTNSSRLYGVENGSTDERTSELPDERRGLLTRAHYLASHRPVARGVTLLDRVLCRPLAPPANINTELDESDAPLRTPRETFEAHSANPACAGCHRTIDPLAFSFENFDSTGAARDSYDNGVPVDASGSLSWPSDLSFQDSTQLLDMIAGEQVAHACYTERWAEWALGRALSRAERCAYEDLSTPEEPLSIRELIIRIATSDLMRFRKDPTRTES